LGVSFFVKIAVATSDADLGASALDDDDEDDDGDVPTAAAAAADVDGAVAAPAAALSFLLPFFDFFFDADASAALLLPPRIASAPCRFPSHPPIPPDAPGNNVVDVAAVATTLHATTNATNKDFMAPVVQPRQSRGFYQQRCWQRGCELNAVAALLVNLWIG